MEKTDRTSLQHPLSLRFRRKLSSCRRFWQWNSSDFSMANDFSRFKTTLSLYTHTHLSTLQALLLIDATRRNKIVRWIRDLIRKRRSEVKWEVVRSECLKIQGTVGCKSKVQFFKLRMKADMSSFLVQNGTDKGLHTFNSF